MTSTKAKAAHTSPKASKASGFDAKKKLSNAVKTAKQRCTNPKNPDYPSYGAKGIKCLVTAPQLAAAIGLPKNKDVSLDRMDPTGHYEIGNVRWTNTHVQAANKVRSASTPQFHVHQSQLHAVEETLKYRSELTEIWNVGIRGHNNRGLSTKDRGFLESTLFAGNPLAASFKWDGPKEFGGPPGEFCMPSLTSPGDRVRVRGGGWAGIHMPNPSAAIVQGVIYGLGYVEPLWNIPKNEMELIKQARQGEACGIIWEGNPLPSALNAVEGRMLAAASRLFVRQHGKGALFPALTIFELLDKAAPSWISELEYHPIARAHSLFVPDLQVDHGIGWSPNALQCSQFLQLLQYRSRHQLKTFLGIQNSSKLSPALSAYLYTPSRFLRTVIGMYPEHPEPKELQPHPQGDGPAIQSV